MQKGIIHKSFGGVEGYYWQMDDRTDRDTDRQTDTERRTDRQTQRDGQTYGQTANGNTQSPFFLRGKMIKPYQNIGGTLLSEAASF